MVHFRAVGSLSPKHISLYQTLEDPQDVKGQQCWPFAVASPVSGRDSSWVDDIVTCAEGHWEVVSLAAGTGGKGIRGARGPRTRKGEARKPGSFQDGERLRVVATSVTP